MAVWTSRTLAAPVTFPGCHDGFIGAASGRTGDPGAFAATLRGVLDGTASRA